LARKRRQRPLQALADLFCHDRDVFETDGAKRFHVPVLLARPRRRPWRPPPSTPRPSMSFLDDRDGPERTFRPGTGRDGVGLSSLARPVDGTRPISARGPRAAHPSGPLVGGEPFGPEQRATALAAQPCPELAGGDRRGLAAAPHLDRPQDLVP